MTKSDIEKALKNNKLIIGMKSVKAEVLSEKRMEKIIMARNCPETIRNYLIKLSKLLDVVIESSSVDSIELGSLVKKPFPVIVLGIKR